MLPVECDKIQIHAPASIQPVGFAIILDSDFMVLDFAGEIPFDISRNQNLRDICSELVDGILASCFDDTCYFKLKFSSTLYDFSYHKNGNISTLEALPHLFKKTPHVMSVYKNILQIFDKKNSIQTTYDLLTKYIYDLSGFDRVMLYVFGDDGHGEVVSEAKQLDTKSFLHHHFPATDIPLPAREMYAKNSVRVVYSASKEPFGLKYNSSVDMSSMNIRAIAGIHREYLVNMGVESSMSISIVVDDALWGLVACHQISSKIVSMDEIELFKHISQVLSHEMTNAIKMNYLTELNINKSLVDKLCSDMRYKVSKMGITAVLDMASKELCRIFASDGAAVVGRKNNSGHIITRNDTTITCDFLKILYDKTVNMTMPFVIEDNLDIDMMQLSEGKFAGVATIKVDNEYNFVIYLFRKEMIKTIKWAGDPAKDDTSGFLSPRQSFDEWQETVKARPQKYTKAEKAVIVDASFKLIETVSVMVEMLEVNNEKILMAIDGEKQKSSEYLELVEVIVFALDENGNIILINRKACNLLGYSKEELIGKNWFHTCLRQDEQEEVFDVFKNLMAGNIEPVEHYENYVVTKDQKERLIAWHNTSLRDENSKIIGVLTSGEDITDKVKAQSKADKLTKKLKSANKKLESMSVIDSLTNTYNRRHFNATIDALYRTACRMDSPIGFLLLDIDNFKKYNDSYGHVAGDKVLKSISSTCKKCLKPGCDYLFRLGGEEFCAIIISKTRDDIVRLSEKIRTEVENLQIEHTANESFGIATVSGGLKVVEACGSYDIAIYEQADKALYQAKSTGRNTIVVV
jgi:diguanylate cyclase (GGDEF)-like protein/PAS domain S-box-containing protein